MDVPDCLQKQHGTDSVQNLTENKENCDISVKTYKRRFWMLFLFSTLTMLAGILFPEYVSIADITMCYYGVNADSVNWTTMIVMVVYLIGVIPISWFMVKVGLKVTLIVGSLCNTIAFAVQFASLTPKSFAFVILSSFFGSLSNVFVLSVPPCLAATWFPSQEVSRACAVGISSNQLGVALGFIISPLLISNNCSSTELIMEGKRDIATIFTAINAAILLLIIFTFQNEPLHPPSTAQLSKQDLKISYVQSAWSMVRNVDFILIFITFGFMIGTFFAITTLLNNLMIQYFPDAQVAIGWMGLLLIISGIVGSIIVGYILDYTHKFKETTIILCFLSFVSCVVFSCLLPLNKLWVQYLTIGVLGFFLTGFVPVCFEYAIEVTYPESEITSAGLLNASMQIFGIILIQIASFALEYGSTYSNIVLCSALLMSTIASCFISKDYKRSMKNDLVDCVTRL